MAMEEKKVTENIREEEFLKRVEKAAKDGAKKGQVGSTLLQMLPTLLLIGLLLAYVIPKIEAFNSGIDSIFHIEDPAQSHDMVVEDDGIFGYTAADFEDAVLGDSSKLKKLEVFEQEVSDVVTATDTGFMNWGVFTKTKLITYNGTAVYTVDLSSLKKGDILFNEEEKIITLRIPHAVQEEINIPEDQIQFGDTQGGLLAFGELKLTPEQTAQIQSGARQKMQEKLDNDKVIETADRFAKLAVWEMYSPIIKGVAKDYSLEVEFR